MNSKGEPADAELLESDDEDGGKEAMMTMGEMRRMRRRRAWPKHLGLGVNWRDTNRAYSRLCSRPLTTRCLLLAPKTTRAASGTSLNASSSSASK